MMRLYRMMISVAGEFAGALRRTLFCSAVAALMQAAGWAIALPLFQRVLAPGPLVLGSMLPWLAGLLGLMVAEGVLRWREADFIYRYWHRVTEAMRLRLARRLRAMPLERLAQRKSGDLATILGNNVTFAATAISSLATLAVQLLIVPAALLLLIFVLDWRLGGVLAIGALLIVPVMRQARRRANNDFQRIDRADAQASAAIVEYVQGQAMLRASGRSGTSAPCLEQVFHRQHEAQHQAGGTVRYIAHAQLLMQLTMLATVALGLMLYSEGELPLASLLCLILLVVQMVEPLTLGLSMVRLFELADASLQRINVLLAEADLITQVPQQQPEGFDFSLENVSFRYENQTAWAVNNLTLSIPEKSLTALVGPSGGGKTTLTRLLSRFADPQQGGIRLGGADLRHLPPESLLSSVAVVFQDVWLMDDSLASNIALGKPGATLAEVEDAARKAHIHHVISRLPQGYDTRAGEAGSALSGGERQRIAIARAILKDAPVVLLDEPTASLDSESEYQVQKAIEALVADKTVVIVAHRLSTIRAADRIAYIANGGCLELGSHEQLMAHPEGHYRQLVMAQR
ncbi:ABC transporter ATP-binding protein [Erwinia sp. S38]|uniref:ABC transporter ATP-binding protein n=1 Tax=Erwinia sp. S38 TaxID=2769338 RepID=UPI00190BEF5F|nr:ABC transporter ATP-binding protein [Erwinia sp. S38]MBK0003734.1 ABC transporter ATP-binding protein [Erwinia sp. S38]